MAEIYYYNEWLTGACGVEHLSDFGKESKYHRAGPANYDKPGCGLHTAGFIDTEVCKTLYNELKEKWKIVYQSPPRRNVNSGNQFIFVVWDDEQTTEGNSEYKFPWDGDGSTLDDSNEDYDDSF